MEAVIVSAARTATGRFLGALRSLTAPQLGAIVVREAVSRAGIDPAIQGRIFEPFFSTKSAGEGTGVSLAIVHGIVRAHEGAIDLKSEPGKGTTFHVYFPAVQAAIQAGAATEPASRAPGRGRHVLFLDDNETLVSAMVRSLSRRGYRVSG